MALRVAISILALFVRSSALCNSGDQCSVNEEEGMSTLQMQQDVAMKVSNDTECMHFYTHDCGLPRDEAPSRIEHMRDAFVQCCIKSGNYERDVCQPFMEQIFEGHGQPSVLLCSKLASARQEHHRFVQLLQRKTNAGAGVTLAELDTTVNRKLGFGPAQKNFACAENWEERLHRASRVKNVDECKHKCEFSPECEAISFTDETCVLCGTPTMAYRLDWTTYVKQGTTHESRARCQEDKDCDYHGCNTHRGGGWEYQCLMKGKSGTCVNRNRHSHLCVDRPDDDMPVPGHWCWNHHLYRVCSKNDDENHKN